VGNRLTALLSTAFLFLSFASGVNAQGEPLGGQPDPGAKQSVMDLDEQVAYQRAFEAVVWAMPASITERFRVGLHEIPGVADNVIAATSRPITQIKEGITTNSSTPYISATADLRNGPVVLEVPAKTAKGVMYGQVVDAWQLTIAGVGPSGQDKGAGGKYLFLPPGYKGAVPEGYFPVHSTTYRILLAFRSIQLGGATLADAFAYSKSLKMYPLSEAANPKPGFVDATPSPLRTLPFYDIRALQTIHDIISVEPVQPQDKVMMGMLATIGIEPGKPFDPSPKLKAAMERGVVDAYYYMQEQDTKLFAANLYWPDRHWSFVMVPDAKRRFDFVTDDAVQIDKRGAARFFYTFYPEVLPVDAAATVYLAPIADSSGQPVIAGKNYRVRVPKDTPAKQFWAITVYDRATWAFIKSPLDRAGLDSFSLSKMKKNSDGSVDVYFGPKAPDGLESNWIPTEGHEPYVWLRLYGPEEAFWNKSFKMPDVELVN
jgi:hypothetical protein